MGSYPHIDKIEAGIFVAFADQRLRHMPEAKLESEGDASPSEMPSDAFKRFIAARKHGVCVYDRKLFGHFCYVPVHTGDLKGSFFYPKDIPPSLKVVIPDFNIFDSTDGLELRPVNFILLAKTGQGLHKILTAGEYEKEAVVYLHRFHAAYCSAFSAATLSA